MLNKLLLKSKSNKNDTSNQHSGSSEYPSTGVNSTQGLVSSQKGSIPSSSVNSIANIQSLTSSLTACNSNNQSSKSQSTLSNSINRQLSPTHSKDIEKLNLRAQTQIPQSKQRNQQSSRSSLKHNSSTESEPIFTPKTSANKQKTDSAKSTIQRVAVNLNTLDEFANDPIKRIGQIRESHVKNASDSSRKGSISNRNGIQSASIQGELKRFLGFDQKESGSQLSNQFQNKPNLNELPSSLNETSIQKQFYQDLQWSSLNRGRFDCLSQAEEPTEVSSAAMLQLIYENKKMKQQIEFIQQETKHWRSKYESLEKLKEEQEKRTKEKYDSEIKLVNNQLLKLKLNQLGAPIPRGTITTSSTRISPFNRGVFKENLGSSNQGVILNDDWQDSYGKLKEDKEKIEKALKKKIQSLEEQNAFLQLESIEARKNQKAESIIIQGKQSIQEHPFQEQKQNDLISRSIKSSNLKDLTSYFTQNLN